MRPEQARRIAIAAQGLARARPAGRVDVRHFRRVLDTTHVVQLDSVNVLARAHYMPFFSRLGPYDRDRLDRFLWRDREAFEYIGHAASVMPMRLHPLLRHRMHDREWQAVRDLESERPGYLDAALDLVRAEGPVTIGDLEDGGRRGGDWWDWGHARIALEWLYLRGELAIDRRDRQFALHYDLPMRVIPADVLDQGTVAEERAQEQLVLLAARALGIATSDDIADYWRMRLRPTRAALARLVTDGRLAQVSVPGWHEPTYLHPEAVMPRRASRAALLSPFDPLVWYRDRTERLFGFHYRIEIYVPEPDRRYGYYVLPFLLGDRLVGRVDLKADRRRRRLLVPGAFAEDEVDVPEVGRALAAELRLLASWLDLDRIEVGERGGLASAVRRALR